MIAPKALDRDDAEKWLAEVCAGVSVVVVDSFRAAWPSLDENASDSRRALDTLFRVSERTGAAFVVIHHSGKKSGERGQRERLRGSSALFDACQNVLLFEPTSEEPGSPVRVTQAKARLSGIPAKPFELVISDVERGIEPKWGLAVTVGSREPRDDVAELERDVLAAVRAEPGASLNRIKLRLQRRKADVGDALRDLAERGLIYHQESNIDGDGTRRARGWYACQFS
jgi:hypothetical protein